MSSHRSGSGGSLSPVSEVNRRSTLKPTNYDLQKQHYDDADGGDSGRRHLYIDQSNYRMNSFAPQNAWEPMPRGWLQLLRVARSYLLQIAQSCLFKGKIAWVARSKKPCECNLISFKLLEVACICLKLLEINAFSIHIYPSYPSLLSSTSASTLYPMNLMWKREFIHRTHS